MLLQTPYVHTVADMDLLCTAIIHSDVHGNTVMPSMRDVHSQVRADATIVHTTHILLMVYKARTIHTRN